VIAVRQDRIGKVRLGFFLTQRHPRRTKSGERVRVRVRVSRESAGSPVSGALGTAE
jgi:hypothetical protein